MINVNRPVEVMLFQLTQAMSFGDITIEAGLNQVRRNADGNYDVFHLGDREAYAYLLSDEMSALMHEVCKKLLYPDEQDRTVSVPYHIHEKKKLKIA